MKRAAIYSRVSTHDQHIENQTILLRELVANNGWVLVEEYGDVGISGAAGREARPAFDKLLKDMVRRKFDVIVVWDVSRLGRSLQHLVGFLADTDSARCDLVIHQQGLDTSTPGGRMLFQMTAVFAEFERSMISERVKLGLARARRRGARIGRPPIATPDTSGRVLNLLAAGESVARICEVTGISRSTVYRLSTMKRTAS